MNWKLKLKIIYLASCCVAGATLGILTNNYPKKTSPTSLIKPIEQSTEQIQKVVDGDTIRLKSGGYVRFYCIDAPEKTQLPFGQESKEYLEMVLHPLTIFNVTSYGKDKYGRVIGEVYEDGVLVNKRLVEQGLAVVYPQYCKNEEYYKAEAIAKQNKVGIWSQANPVMPWDYRKEKKESK